MKVTESALVNILFSLFLFWGSTVRQEQELRNGGAIDKKLTTLADLFRPPIDLMHKGSFETVGHFDALNIGLALL